MSSSQPILTDNDFSIPSLKRTYTGTIFPSRSISLTDVDIDKKIEELTSFINENTKEDVKNGEEFTTEEILTQDDEGREAKFFYFIGRLNPPHQGHIETLNELVRRANAESSIPPLILLGNGPKGLRTMDNPIDFSTKEKFIRRVLPGSYEIKEMTNPAQNVSKYIKDNLEGIDISKLERITINHIAGGKDDDSTKLDFVKNSAEKKARSMVPEADVTTDTIIMPAGRSATKVRKDAYKTVLNGTGYIEWPEEHKIFYGDDAEEIYTKILEPLNDIKPEFVQHSIINYLSTGELPPNTSKKSRGGTKRRNKRNKKKTQKRRRRTSRRKY